MHRLYAIFFLLCAPLVAQFSSVAAHITYGSTLPTHCKPGTGDIFFKNTATIGPYYCSATDTWTFFGTAGGGGAVTGPGSSTDSAVALFDGTSGTVLKNSSLLFDGSTLSGAQTVSTGDGTVAGCASWKELAANGTNFRKWCSPDALTASLTINWADALPTAGQAMVFSAPSSSVTTQSWADVLTPSSTKTLTNTTYDTAGTGNSFSINGVAATANTGAGAVARAVSPSFTTPALGTPSAINLTNATALPSPYNIRAFGYSFDGGGSALTAGATGYLTIPYACTIAAWNISVDAGTATVDIWKIATGTAVPTVSNTITASAIPAISTGTSIHSTTLTSWTTSVAANDIIGINLKVVATATNVNLTVQCNQ